MNPYEKLIEKILAGPLFSDELKAARKSFFGSASFVEDHPESFDQHMSQFYDWYFFSRPLSGYSRTPLEVCEIPRELRYTPEEARYLQDLRGHVHSLFEFLKLRGSDVHVRDLIRDKKIVVSRSEKIFGFSEDVIFEARLIPAGDTWIFSRGFCFHPADVRKFILEEIKRHRKNPDLDPEELMFRLARMRFLSEKYKHIRPEMIYSSEPKLTI
ncbi:MAG: hypothetical protein N2578_01305 [Bdellovibrionaceae bacterium]|nr:hypothetical protein [Pseudobdellovibrionaceae bacterium]